MKRLLLAGTAFLGLAGLGSVACATLIDFTYTGSLVDFTVPTTGTYQIVAFGAQGGNGQIVNFLGETIVSPGGNGAEIGGNFNLTASEVLQIAVGGAGGDDITGGGGGGTFVIGPGNTPLVIAGGGGGNGSAFSFANPFPPAQGGLTGQDGGSGMPTFPMNGGTNGNGGGGGCLFPGGGGGGGFFSAGSDGCGNDVGGGGGFPDLAGGLPASSYGAGGGFGGGGGGDIGGGGGGGYSGGGGGDSGCYVCLEFGSGGGGGSFDAGIDQILVADFQSGNGEVVITEVAITEPASLALLGSALIGLGVVRQRSRLKT